jgi:hypothetical protein
MEVWMLEWSYPYDNENNVTLWTNQLDAQKQAVKEINELINDWDLEDNDAAACADDINDMVGRGQFGEAIKRFIDYQDEHNADYAQYYFVTKKQVLGSGSVASPSSGSSFIATTSGATCRGPCGQYNEYANADQPDGTHVCHQCSTFQHIFGTKS